MTESGFLSISLKIRHRYSPIRPSITIIKPNKNVISATRVLKPGVGLSKKNELITMLAPNIKLAEATINPMPEIIRIGVTENPSITSKKVAKFFDKVHLDFPLLRALR